MQLEEANGVNGHEEASAPPTAAELVEAEIQRELDRVEVVLEALKKAQAYEVANVFLCDARSLARAGKVELAERKLKAARNVLSGGKRDE